VDTAVEQQATLTVTAKGQVTLRKDVLKHLGVQPGEKIIVDMLPNGQLKVRAARQKGHISKFFGSLQKDDGISLTIDEINEIAAKGWAGEL
jgi:bifunctional DNA-binding transcriptional regulator/antitoxin component of YhaV-PrlF toxin-antitoxin module